MPSWFMFVIIGIVGGIAAGFFGIGGGIIIVPALIYWAGFSQHMATGTAASARRSRRGIRILPAWKCRY